MAPYLGHCLCGAVAYRLTEEPLTFYACHCTDCQRRTGAAFALSMIVRRAALELTRGEPGTYEARLADGRRKAGRLCTACGTRLWGDPRDPEIAVVQAGTLEQPCGLEPVAHIWTRSTQPWIAWPDGAVKYETQPSRPGELARLWRERGARGG